MGDGGLHDGLDAWRKPHCLRFDELGQADFDELGQAELTQAELGEAEPSESKPSQAKPSLVTSHSHAGIIENQNSDFVMAYS